MEDCGCSSDVVNLCVLLHEARGFLIVDVEHGQQPFCYLPRWTNLHLHFAVLPRALLLRNSEIVALGKRGLGHLACS